MVEVARRPQQFLVMRQSNPLMIMAAGPADMPVGGLRVVDTIAPTQIALQSAGPSGVMVTHIVEAETPEREAELLAMPYGPVTPNRLLVHAAPMPLLTEAAPLERGTAAVSVRLTVQDAGQNPIQNALVKAYGSNVAQGTTDANGLVTLTFLTGSLLVDALYVKPCRDYWEKWLTQPALNDGGTVTLSRLESWRAAGFTPASPYFTWAQNLLGFNAVDVTQLTGFGIKVAVADSGCDTTHPLSRHFQYGVTYVDPGTPANWAVDTIGHGTWCSTLIGGRDDATGIRGYCPQAEMHTLKMFPGGAYDSLQRALIYAVDNQIDVMSLSLGSSYVDPGTQARLRDAVAAGVAVFVAAGNSYGTVQFPASEQGAFAVAAIGQAGTFPPDTYHARTQIQQTRPGANGSNGIFAPDFTAAGDAIQACAPGVAVISGAPGGGYAAEDGTSMACPQMAGLAALALAHHPALRGQPRSVARTQMLYSLLRQSAQMTGLSAAFSGAGMPSMLALEGHQAAPQQAPQMPDIAAIAQVVANILASSGAGLSAH